MFILLFWYHYYLLYSLLSWDYNEFHESKETSLTYLDYKSSYIFEKEIVVEVFLLNYKSETLS